MVAAHRKFDMPSDLNLYLPVLVGAQGNYRDGIEYQRDDDGINISYKNPNYNELTAIYWAWKNMDKDIEAIGLVHYRRFLSLNRKRKLENILNFNEVNSLLKIVPVILPRKRNYYIETIYSHYIHSHNEEPLDITRKVLAKDCPEYLPFFDRAMESRSAHMFNMFVMKRRYFDSYCKWLFDVLEKVEGLVDITNYSKQEARVYGYLSEILLDVWIYKNNVKYLDVPWVQMGKRNLVAKYGSFVKRKLFPNLKGNTHF